jgi:hypothetical protein
MPHNYLKNVHEQAKEITKPGLFIMVVFHQSDCNYLTNKGECNCHPETATRKVGKDISIEEVARLMKQSL